MPKFVPVADPEMSRNEQNFNSAENMKHRKFDNPHAVLKPKVDRGWQQGSLGWGVLGSFGSDEKDDAAQVIRRGEGSAKMIKNEKGLWVKAKDHSMDEINTKSSSSSSDTKRKSKGVGRGGGISVFDTEGTLPLGSKRHNHVKRNDDEYTNTSTHRKFDDADPDDYAGSRKRSKSSMETQDKEDRRSDSDSRTDSRDRDRHSERNRETRIDSRDRDRQSERNRETRIDSRDRDRHSERNRDSHRGSGSGRDRDSRTDRVRTSDRDRDTERPVHHKDNIKSDKILMRKMSQDRDDNHDDSDDEEEKEVITDETEFALNAIQIVNRFLELFNDTNSSALQRVDNIAELFKQDAIIASLKSDKSLLVGRDAIRQSFMKTTPSVSECSRRLFIPSLPFTIASKPSSPITSNDDHTNNRSSSSNSNNSSSSINDVKKSTSSSSSCISFCLDLHPPESSPGLGDRSKDTVLLYRCEFNKCSHNNHNNTSSDNMNDIDNNTNHDKINKDNSSNNRSNNSDNDDHMNHSDSAHITHVWGAVDPQNLASKAELTEMDLFQSAVWKWTLQILTKQLPEFDYTSKTYFHDYTNIETI